MSWGEKIYKVQYRVRVHDVDSDWQTLMLNTWLYFVFLNGPDILTTLHWRRSEIMQAFRNIESDICKIIDMRLTEVTILEAYTTHQELCPHCKKCGMGSVKPDGEHCHPGKRLFDRWRELEPTQSAPDRPKVWDANLGEYV